MLLVFRTCCLLAQLDLMMWCDLQLKLGGCAVMLYSYCVAYSCTHTHVPQKSDQGGDSRVADQNRKIKAFLPRT